MSRSGLGILRRFITAGNLTQAAPMVSTQSACTESPDNPMKFFEFELVDKNVFRAKNRVIKGQYREFAMYGGLIMSQGLAAAENTVSDEFKPHSVHACFILTADPRVPVDYSVRLLRDGRSFCTRSVEAIQKGKVVFALQASFHVVEPDTCAHEDECPTGVKPPEECEQLQERAGELLARIESGEIEGNASTVRELRRYIENDRSDNIFDIRCTDTAAMVGLAERPKRFFYWMRCRHALPPNAERLHRWLVFLVSDACPFGTMYRPHIRNRFSPSMAFTLDHLVHFHEHAIRADEWLLFELHSPRAGGARGFARGHIWSAAGKLLASVTQECLIRTRGEPSRL